MRNKYSEIDYYEKGKFKNAFPLRLSFDLNLMILIKNLQMKNLMNSLTTMHQISNLLRNKDKNLGESYTKNSFDCVASGYEFGISFPYNKFMLNKEFFKLFVNFNKEINLD